MTIQAVKCAEALRDSRLYWHQMPDWLAEAYENGKIVFGRREISISTLDHEGTMIANYDDWIIQGVAGEIYPCKPDIFSATYEYVPEAEHANT